MASQSDGVLVSPHAVRCLDPLPRVLDFRRLSQVSFAASYKTSVGYVYSKHNAQGTRVIVTSKDDWLLQATGMEYLLSLVDLIQHYQIGL